MRRRRAQLGDFAYGCLHFRLAGVFKARDFRNFALHQQIVAAFENPVGEAAAHALALELQHEGVAHVEGADSGRVAFAQKLYRRLRVLFGKSNLFRARHGLARQKPPVVELAREKRERLGRPFARGVEIRLVEEVLAQGNFVGNRIERKVAPRGGLPGGVGARGFAVPVVEIRKLPVGRLAHGLRAVGKSLGGNVLEQRVGAQLGGDLPRQIERGSLENLEAFFQLRREREPLLGTLRLFHFRRHCAF